MPLSPRVFRPAAVIAFAAVAMAAAGCGGTSSSTPNTPAATPTTTPAGTSTPVAGATPTSVATTGSLGSTATLPTVAGYGASLTFASAPSPSGVSETEAGYNYAPAGVPTNGPTSQPSPASGSATVVAAWTFSAAQAITLTSSPALTFSGLAAPPSGKAYYSYFADITAHASNGYQGPYTYANGEATDTSGGGNANTMTLNAGDSYVLELVYF